MSPIPANRSGQIARSCVREMVLEETCLAHLRGTYYQKVALRDGTVSLGKSEI